MPRSSGRPRERTGTGYVSWNDSSALRREPRGVPKQLDLLIVAGDEQPCQRFASWIACERLASLRDGSFDRAETALHGGDGFRSECMFALSQLTLEIARDRSVFVLESSQSRRQRPGRSRAGRSLLGTDWCSADDDRRDGGRRDDE